MNRIDICKNIIQSIKEYITNPEKLEPHRAKNHFVRKRKLSLFQVIMYLLYTSKASMFQNLSRIRANYAQTECQFRYCGTAIPFLTVRSTAR